MIQFPNCKINLGLNISGKRSDGFHNIETIFYPVPFCDVLEIIAAADGVFQFETSGLSIPGDHEQNLCVKALQLLQADHDFPRVKMCLHKVIPMGSGLGGGSSDGAFTLKMVNELFALGLSNQDLMNYANVLGSDCAFFIENQPQFAHGKGDFLESVEIDLSGLFIVIVIPDIHVVTAEAYQMVTPKQPNHSIKEIIQYPIPEWKNFLVNDFENPVLAKYPVIGGIKQQLYDAGALFAALSGSGSAVYGLFSENPKFNSVFMKGNSLYSGYL